jgi:D-alanyl-D-alanine carboxypeptidase
MLSTRRNFSQGLALALGAAAAGATAAQAQTHALKKPSLAKIDEAINGFIAAGRAPGVSVAVMRSRQVLLSRSYGIANLETGTPVTSETVFRAGSVTKQFTAAAILLLAQDDRLRIDDPLVKYVPELAAAGPVTLRTMLNHTSGIHTYTDEPFVSQMRLAHTPQQMVDYIAGQAKVSDFTPGSEWRYSNSNFYLLGVVVERLSGLSLHDFLARQVIPRARLKATTLDREEDVVAHRACGYVPISGEPGGFRHADFISMDPPGGAGALRATSLDLAHWHQALLAGEVVSQASLTEMTTPGRLTSNLAAVRDRSPATQTPQGYGFGLEMGALDGEPTIGHGGGIPGYATYLVTFPRLNVTIATMTNGEPSGKEPFTEIAKAVLSNFR